MVDFYCITVLCLASCNQFNLLQRVNDVNNNSSHSVLKDYNDIFGSLGCLPIKCHIRINNAVQPIIDEFYLVCMNNFVKIWIVSVI